MKDKNIELEFTDKEFKDKRYEIFKKYVSTLTRLQVLTSFQKILLEIPEYSTRDETQRLMYMKLIIKELDNELSSEEYNRVVDKHNITASDIKFVVDNIEHGSVNEDEFKEDIIGYIDFYLPNEGECDE